MASLKLEELGTYSPTPTVEEGELGMFNDKHC